MCLVTLQMSTGPVCLVDRVQIHSSNDISLVKIKFYIKITSDLNSQLCCLSSSNFWNFLVKTLKNWSQKSQQTPHKCNTKILQFSPSSNKFWKKNLHQKWTALQHFYKPPNILRGAIEVRNCCFCVVFLENFVKRLSCQIWDKVSAD